MEQFVFVFVCVAAFIMNVFVVFALADFHRMIRDAHSAQNNADTQGFRSYSKGAPDYPPDRPWYADIS